MKRSGFTMIELIFVIVILGILAAVAIPKLAQTATDAKISKAEAFIGTFNRSTSAAMWSKAINTTGGTGSIKALTLKDFTELPDGFTLNLASCGISGTDGANAGAISTAALPVAEIIYCRDGNGTTAPMLGFTADMNQSVQNN